MEEKITANSSLKIKIKWLVLFATGACLLSLACFWYEGLSQSKDHDVPTSDQIRSSLQIEKDDVLPPKSRKPLSKSVTDVVDLVNNVEDAREKLLQLDSNETNVSHRSVDAARIVCKLAALGFVEEAWNLVDESPGLVRSKQISWLMSLEEISLDTKLHFLKSLDHPDDRRNATKSIFRNLNPDQILNEDISSKLVAAGVKDGSVENLIGQSIESYLKDISEIDATNKNVAISNALAITEKLAANGKINPQAYVQILEDYSDLTAFERWEKLTSLRQSFKEEAAFGRARKKQIDSIINDDAERAIGILQKLEASTQNMDSLSYGISTWYRKDSKKANQWIQDNFSSLQSPQKDAIATQLTKIALAERDKQTALQWANSIQDPKARETMIKKVE